jgi:broad specificity phosphatase PhoE
MRRWLSCVFLIFGVSCGHEATPVTPTALPSPLPSPTLLSQVTRGGYVVFFRHAARDTGAISTDELLAIDRAGVCVPGSELTAEGTADAAAIGAAFRRLNIRVDHVYASPTCRTRQMAELAFGTFDTTLALAWPEIWSEDEAGALASRLPELLGSVPPKGTIVVLISHNGVLIPSRMGLDIGLDQAEAAIFRPHGHGQFEFVGRIPKAEWLASQ